MLTHRLWYCLRITWCLFMYAIHRYVILDFISQCQAAILKKFTRKFGAPKSLGPLGTSPACHYYYYYYYIPVLGQNTRAQSLWSAGCFFSTITSIFPSLPFSVFGFHLLFLLIFVHCSALIQLKIVLFLYPILFNSSSVPSSVCNVCNAMSF